MPRLGETWAFLGQSWHAKSANTNQVRCLIKKCRRHKKSSKFKGVHHCFPVGDVSLGCQIFWRFPRGV